MNVLVFFVYVCSLSCKRFYLCSCIILKQTEKEEGERPSYASMNILYL